MAHAAPTHHQAVELADDFTAALEAGEARADAYYAAHAGTMTLVGALARTEVAEWDGSDELSLVFDPDGIDLPDDVSRDIAA